MKKKKRNIIILCIICIIVLVGAFILDSKLGKNYFIELEYQEVIDKIENKESFVLCLSQTTCSHCASYKPKLERVANDNKIEIYYIEVDLLNEEENNKFKSYVNFSSTPTTVFINNGEEKTAASRINGDASQDKILKKLKSNGFID